MLLSVVIPVFNEEDTIPLLCRELDEVLNPVTTDFEVIFVDDGSSDNSLEQLIIKHREDKRYKIVSLSRNFGHQAAFTAGLEFSKGKFVVMMDGDMQDPPSMIKQLYDKSVNNDFDVVFAYRTEREEKGLKKMLFKMFHRIFSNMSNFKIPANAGNFSIMTRPVVVALLEQKEKSMYLPGLRSFVGFRQGQIDYKRPARAKGKAKMTYGKLFQLAIDAIFSFSNLPLRVCLYLGIFGIVISFFIGIFTLASKIIGTASPGWSSTLISIYMFGSIQLVFLGVLGEYVYRIYKEVQNRSKFIVRRFYE